MMKRYCQIILGFLLGCLTLLGQVNQTAQSVKIKGTVKGKETLEPIPGVEVSTDKGAYAITDFLGEYTINVAIGDELVFSSAEFETKRHRVTGKDDVDLLVEGYRAKSGQKTDDSAKTSVTRSTVNLHQHYIDSALVYKIKDIAKSIGFITRSIEQLGERANKKDLATSLSVLGEIYEYHGQFDLAITSYQDALAAHKTTKNTLLLANAHVLDKDFENAEKVLLPLLKVKGLVPYQQVMLYESLGDVYASFGQYLKAIAYYNQGLQVASKSNIAPKMTDLNSKIADTYAKADQSIEAEGFYGNSLKLAESQAPERAIQEKEKVADFYSKKNRYDEEIQLRKKSLDELKNLPDPVVKLNSGTISADTITSQRINYKIANAYIAQYKYDQAIPYLEKSIFEADSENDLIVQKDATRKLSEVYEQRGDFTKALETYQAYVSVVDTLYIRKEQEISRAARFNREISEGQSRIKGLEQERELSQSKYDLALTEQQVVQANNRRQRWIIYSLIVGLVLLGLTAFFFYRSDKQQKLANNLLALRSLRSQMNPHFIFNALNSVNNYIAKNDERSANRYISDFSSLMRSVLENSEEDFIPLATELELLQLYVKLEHSRFPDKFDFTIHIDGQVDVAAFQIPPMLLQPYIENAIWHGLRYREEKGWLKIDVQHVAQNTIVVTIADNGIGRERSAALKTQGQKQQKSKGMGNIKKRVAILNNMYKNKVEVAISDLEPDGTGTKVRFTLKKD